MFIVTVPPDDSLKLRRSGMDSTGDYHAAPMGLQTVLFGRRYYKHVAPTELAAQLPAVTAPLASRAVVRCQFGILTVEMASPDASTGHL